MVAGASCCRHGHTRASAPDTTMPPKAGFMGGIACLLSGLAPFSPEVESPGIPGRFKTPTWWSRPAHTPQTDDLLRAKMSPEPSPS
jgi:hypothetical protein